jgi:hypothetical protein
MKRIYLSVTVEVPDDETSEHWDALVTEMAALVASKGYDVYADEYGEA